MTIRNSGKQIKAARPAGQAIECSPVTDNYIFGNLFFSGRYCNSLKRKLHKELCRHSTAVNIYLENQQIDDIFIYLLQMNLFGNVETAK